MTEAAKLEALLYTLGPSHYCERARWALDRRAIPYAEHRLALGPHAVRLRAMGLASTGLPVLRLADGTLIQGSDRILDHCGFAIRDPEAERRFEATVGVQVRRFVYAAAFSAANDGGVLDILLDGVSGPERLAGKAIWPSVRARIAAGLDVGPATLPAIAEAIEAELDWFDVAVADPEAPLDGAFGRADITAASLLAPLARPREGAVRKPLDLGSDAAALLQRWSARPSLLWVKATYAAHRRAVEPLERVSPASRPA